MLHIQNPTVRRCLLKGEFGLELESLRVTRDGILAQTPHPFPGDERIDRDFSESQTEFNTTVYPTAIQAVEGLQQLYTRAQKTLADLPEPECFWPFSNPPYLRSESDIPVAQYYGEKASKTDYRNYLSDRYGRYKMAFSGIHVNYSFAEEMVEAEAEACGRPLRQVKDRLYLDLAERAVEYGWILTAVTAASPVLDRSFLCAGACGGSDFTGMASVRCSELGYWNFFAPVFSYQNLESYVSSMREYVDSGLLRQFSELYYPIRLKPRGAYTLEGLAEKGVNHIELRMFDLNPLVYGCIDVRDVRFAELLLGYLAAMERKPLTQNDQVQAVQNFKSAAHYDLNTVRIVRPDGTSSTAAEAGAAIIRDMMGFYQDASEQSRQVLDFELEKFTDGSTRYAAKVLERYGTDYVKEGLALAHRMQQEALQR